MPLDFLLKGIMMNPQLEEIMNRNSTAKLVDMLIRHEGLRLCGYKDSKGIWSIGVGRNLEGNGLTDEELEFCGLNESVLDNPGSMKITKKDSIFLLYNDIAEIEAELNTHPWFSRLDRVRKDAMIDMCFMGVKKVVDPVRGFKNMVSAFKKDDYVLASKEIIEGDKPGTMSKYFYDVRGARAIEISMMVHSGVYLSKEQLYLISSKKY